MVHKETFTRDSEQDCFEKISERIPDDKIINVIPRGSKREEGYDEYDFWNTYYIDVIYKD